jgi:dipeptidase
MIIPAKKAVHFNVLDQIGIDGNRNANYRETMEINAKMTANEVFNKAQSHYITRCHRRQICDSTRRGKIIPLAVTATSENMIFQSR